MQTWLSFLNASDRACVEVKRDRDRSRKTESWYMSNKSKEQTTNKVGKCSLQNIKWIQHKGLDQKCESLITRQFGICIKSKWAGIKFQNNT